MVKLNKRTSDEIRIIKDQIFDLDLAIQARLRRKKELQSNVRLLWIRRMGEKRPINRRECCTE